MTVSINQPAYLPWLGYFHRIMISDVHVLLDTVQFEKNSFTNRNKLRQKDGNVMLSIPLKTKGLFGDLALTKIEIAEPGWQVKHWKSIQMLYGKSPFFDRYRTKLETLYATPYTRLIDVLREWNGWYVDEFQIKTRMVYASELEPEGKKSDLVLNICKALGAKTYLSGPLGKNYLKEDDFLNEGIAVRYHHYCHPTYRQVFPGFEPYMSTLDLMMNYGTETVKIIHEGNHD